MATYARKLKDRSGNYICPVTRAEQVYFSDNSKLSKLTPYPVGAWFFSSESTSPASLFGGSWYQMKDHFIVGAGNSYGKEQTGGKEWLALTKDNLPGHTHSIPSLTGTAASSGSHTHNWNNNVRPVGWPSSSSAGSQSKDWLGWGTGVNYVAGTTIASGGSHTHTVTTHSGWTGSTGTGKSFDNKPPFVAIYMWKRVS